MDSTDQEPSNREDESDARRAASDYRRHVIPIDHEMGWRMDDVVAAFMAGATWRLSQ